MSVCPLCNEPLSEESHIVKERFFGTGEEFEYKQCSGCMCLQIIDVPADMSKYYPDNYFSRNVCKEYSNNRLLSALRSFRLDSALRDGVFSKILSKPRLPDWVYKVNVHSHSRILDVGCGSGQRLITLRKKGFRHLKGIEPFIDSDIHYRNGVTVHCSDLEGFAELNKTDNNYDLLMMHHSLEHIPDQNSVFRYASILLSKDGLLLIRIPICSSYAWEHYKENWVQLDAPRHLFIHSVKSIELIAKKWGFTMEQYYCDSTEFQFTGSERYLRGISLIEAKDEDLFPAEQIAAFKKRAKELNDKLQGDQAVFVLKKSSTNNPTV